MNSRVKVKKVAKKDSALWSQTFIAVFLGLILSNSLVLNLYYCLPFLVDSVLLIGVLAGFLFWALIMVYCYACNSGKQALLGCLKVLLVSVGINLAAVFLG